MLTSDCKRNLITIKEIEVKLGNLLKTKRNTFINKIIKLIINNTKSYKEIPCSKKKKIKLKIEQINNGRLLNKIYPQMDATKKIELDKIWLNNKLVDNWANENNEYISKLIFLYADNIGKSIYEADLYNHFLSNDLLRYIESKLHFGSIFTINYKNINININIFDEKYYQKLPKFLLDKIKLFLSNLVNNIDSKNLNDIDLTIWLGRIGKKINFHNKFLGVQNINSGVTIKNGSNISKIIIWRKEEIDKVLVHEMIHAFDLDFYQQSNKVLNKIIEHFDIDEKRYINLFEAYTETWAVIFKSCFNGILYYDGSQKKINEMLYYEKIYSLYQTSKILNFFGYSEFGDCNFFCTKKKNFNKKNLFNQGTSILSYYIFKSILLFNLDRFTELCVKKNYHNNPWKFKMGDDVFLDFIIHSLLNTKYISCINKILSSYNKITSSKELDETLRMTLYEFG